MKTGIHQAKIESKVDLRVGGVVNKKWNLDRITTQSVLDASHTDSQLRKLNLPSYARHSHVLRFCIVQRKYFSSSKMTYI